MNRKRTICFTASLLAHALLVWLAVHSSHTARKPPPTPPQPPDTALQLVGIVTKPITPIVVVKPTGQGLTQRCPKGTQQYQGIGIIYTPFEQIITQVPSFTPAYGAGIRKGDVITALHEEGGFIDITVSRGDKTYSFHIKTETICSKQ